MLSIGPPNFVRRRQFKQERSSAPPPPAPLTLVSATYDSDNFWLFLTFDRAIAVDPVLNGDAISLDDGVTWHQFFDGGGGWEFPDPATIKIFLDGGKGSGSTQVLLTATGATQIVAVDNGGIWEGCTSLVVPFP